MQSSRSLPTISSRPQTGASASSSRSRASSRPREQVATVGGHTQGARQLSPASISGYDATKHGWCDPRGQAEQLRLRDQHQPGSHAWLMRKAKDHVGYGVDGRVNLGEVQGTAVSGDAPTWFLGPRTAPGPFGTRKVPVSRCPDVLVCADGVVRYRSKTFQPGASLSTIETHHESAIPPPRTAPKVKDNFQTKVLTEIMHNPARGCNMVSGGCQQLPVKRPSSKFKTEE